MPSDQALITRLEVQATHPDPMTPSDLASAHGTQLASMRELIARRPGQYPNQWLARRSGVSKRTIQRYKPLIPGLQVTPMYAETRLHWGNLNVLPDDTTFMGAFLQDETGQKYPPIAALAARLLKQGRAVHYRRQQANSYGLANPAVITLPQAVRPPPPVLTPIVRPLAAAPAAGPRPPELTGTAAHRQPALPGFVPFRAAPKRTAPPPRRSSRLYHKPLADTEQEALAQRVYSVINGCTTEQADRISLVAARRYVDTYGVQAVERALKRLARRQNVTKPVGWLATVLRCEAKFGGAG